jgi:aspartate-semialdehyde dehydrogenase
MTVSIAVFGASGTLGKEVLDILAERAFPADEVVALTARKSHGLEVSFGDRTLRCRDYEQHDFTRSDLCVMAAGPKTSREWTPKIRAAGCRVIDTSSAFRSDAATPLIVPEVNASQLPRDAGVIACAGSAPSQLAIALKPLDAAVGVRRVVLASYQSASGAGREGMDELWVQTKGVFVNQSAEPRVFPKQIAFNVIPQVDDFLEDGSTLEEQRLATETSRIMGRVLDISSTCVRVPVFVGHALAVHIELDRPMTSAEARRILREAPGVMVVDKREEDGYVTPVECVGEWATYISRIRQDGADNRIALWVVSDNLHNGSALAAVQIAELMLNSGLIAADAR